MLLKCYSLFDSKALQYHPPFFQHTDGAAIRMVADLAADPQTIVGRHPRDYVLYMIGDYDDAKGLMRPISPLQHVVDVIAIVPQTPQLDFGKPAPDAKLHDKTEANGSVPGPYWEAQ